ANASVGVAAPGYGVRPIPSAVWMTSVSVSGGNDDTGTGSLAVANLIGGEYGAGADLHVVAEPFDQCGDGVERVGRVERNLDGREPGDDDAFGDVEDFVGADTAGEVHEAAGNRVRHGNTLWLVRGRIVRRCGSVRWPQRADSRWSSLGLLGAVRGCSALSDLWFRRR